MNLYLLNHQRLSKVLELLSSQNLSQMIITDPYSVFYLTGKSIDPGERLLALYINAKGGSKIIINELFTVPEELGIQKLWFSDSQDPVELLASCINKDKPLGIDKNMPARFLLPLMERNAASAYVNSSPCVDLTRAVKDDKEAKLMRAASLLNDRAMELARKSIRAGMTELELAECVKQSYRSLNADGVSFEPLIAFGANAAIGHHEPDNTVLRHGDCILIDIGCMKDGYCSDMTRTFFLGEPSERMNEIYALVKAANEAARAIIRPGTALRDIDSAARDIIENAGLGRYFTHRLGHFIGIEVHEYGDVSVSSALTAQPGMVFSIEPGIYLPGEGGVRIEDLVLVKDGGCETLNNVSREQVVL